MRRFFYLSVTILAPFLISAACCGLGLPTRSEPQRVVVKGLLDDIVNDVLLVTPFATLTPTPTLTPTLSGQSQGASIAGDANDRDGDGRRDDNGEPIVGQKPIAIPLPTATASPIPSPTPLPTFTPLPIFTPLPTATPLPTSTPLPPTPIPPPPDTSNDNDNNNDNNDDPNSPPTATPTALPTFTPTALPVISFANATYSVTEGDGDGIITVILDRPAGQPVTVNYTTTNITAFAPNDYSPTNGLLTFPTGVTTQTFNVPVVDDNVDDPDLEQVGLSLSNPQNATLGLNPAVLEIIDNDPLPLIKFAATDYFVDEAETPQLTITLDRPSGKNVSFTYGPTSGGTATTPEDYLIIFNVKSLAPDITGVGPISATVAWAGIVDDTTIEFPIIETVIIELSGLTNLNPGDPITTTINIFDDEPQ